MFSPSRVLLLLSIAIGLATIITASPHASDIYINLESISGFESQDKIATKDSIINLSDVAEFGEKTEWRYIHADSLNLVEHRGDCWLSFRACGDSLFITHAESSREQRRFNIETGNRPGAPSRQSYNSESRRDMSFLYADSGRMELRKFITPILILSPGDTIHNCKAEQLTLSFIRREAPALTSDSINSDPDIFIDSALFLPGKPIAFIEETETRWFYRDTRIPVAVSDKILTINEKSDTIETNRSYSFPSELNTERELFSDPPNIDKNRVISKQSEDPSDLYRNNIDTPEIIISGNTLMIRGGTEIKLTLCDIAGRVLIPIRDIKNSEPIDLSSLSAGEYIIHINGPDNTRIHSQTIILHR